MTPELQEFMVRACKHLDPYWLAGYLGVTPGLLVHVLRPRARAPVSVGWKAAFTRQLEAMRPEIELMMKKPRHRNYVISNAQEGTHGRFR